MDQVTQGTAASAEESASASEELAAQAQAMNQVVTGLRTLVGGDGQPDGR
jgi:methyl-accepting chemotaxis protein